MGRGQAGRELQGKGIPQNVSQSIQWREMRRGRQRGGKTEWNKVRDRRGRGVTKPDAGRNGTKM